MRKSDYGIAEFMSQWAPESKEDKAKFATELRSLIVESSCDSFRHGVGMARSLALTVIGGMEDPAPPEDRS